MYSKFDSYYYSRPVAYKSYYPRITKPEILKPVDPESAEVIKYLQRNGLEVNDQGGLARGIRFDDIQIGKRTFNHHATEPQYYIRQWKATNDLSSYHPTGRHYVVTDFNKLMNELELIISNRNKTYK